MAMIARRCNLATLSVCCSFVIEVPDRIDSWRTHTVSWDLKTGRIFLEADWYFITKDDAIDKAWRVVYGHGTPRPGDPPKIQHVPEM